MYDIKKLTPEEKDQAKQYINAIKETKKALKELMSKCKTVEEGGNESTGLTLKVENKKK